jgi:hypothetical protein
MRPKGYPASNRDCMRWNGRLRFQGGGGDVIRLSGGAPWPPVELTRAHLRAPRHVGLGFLAQNRAEGKGILT